MSITYFGNEAAYNDNENLNAYIYANPPAETFTCPGTGLQDLKELAVHARSNGTNTTNVRVAIYETAGGTLVAQGSAVISFTDSTQQWRTHTSFVDSAGSPITPQLTGGVGYRIYGTATGTSSYISRSASPNARRYKAVDYTGGFPASEPTSCTDRDTNGAYMLRAGVEPAASAYGGMMF